MPTKKKAPTRPAHRRRSARAAPAHRPAAREVRTAKPRPPWVDLFREQKKMKAQIASDRAQRYRSFLQQATLPAELPSPAIELRALTLQRGKRALRILAEGDSWFDYPLPWPKGDGVIRQLEKLLGYQIANMAHFGQEVLQMMGLSIRQEIIKRLQDDGVNYDALLFSGGGNDLVGDRLCIWLRDAPPAVPPDQMLNANAVDAALAILEAEYREMVDLRNQYSPQTVIFVHGYDFPPVTGKPVCGKGPWLKPSLDYAYQHLGVPNPSTSDENLVVKGLLQKFNAMLQRVAADPTVQGFHVVATQGTLTDADWQNEIHPSSAGFAKIAQRFQAALAAVFP